MLTKHELRHMVESMGAPQTEVKLRKVIRKNAEVTKTFSLRTLWEGLIGDVDETLNQVMATSPAGLVGSRVVEEVRANAFLHVTSEVIISRVQEGYNSRSGILDQLVNSAPSAMREEKFVGFTAMDGPEDVLEGDEYPDTGFSDRATKGPEPIKRGRRISITDEAIRFDRSGQLLSRAQSLGEKMAIDRERRGIKAIQDLSGFEAFYPYVTGAPTQKALYHDATAGGDWYESFDNLAAANGLSTWENLQTAWLLYKNAKDESGDEILIQPNTLLVPMKLLATAASIKNAVQTRSVGGGAGSDQTTVSANAQVAAMGMSNLLILTSPYMADDTTWYVGDFKSQFWEQVVIPTDVAPLPGNPLRDIVAGFRVRRKSRVYAVDDKFVLKNTA